MCRRGKAAKTTAGAERRRHGTADEEQRIVINANEINECSTINHKEEKSGMKKQILLAAAMLTLAGAVYAAQGDPRTGVLGSVHDMRKPAVGAVEAQDRVCAFCHTPHHAYIGESASDYYPLWARQLDTQNFQSYQSSTMKASDWASDIAIGPTRLCMSCHDGSIAPDQHYGVNGTKAGLSESNAGFDDINWFGGAGVGSGVKGLTNDHPVGFNYDLIATGPESGDPAVALVTSANSYEDPWIRQAGATLAYDANPYGIKVADRLYQDPASGSRFMTCATCHDVHNKKNADLVSATANYLVLSPQKDSALCRTCHIK